MSTNEIVLASNQLAARLGVEKTHMLATIKAQCFRNMNPDNVSDTQLAAFVQIAQSLNLNPLLPGMVYAYPERNGGITPIIGPDGIFSLLTNNSDIEGWSVKHEEIDGEKAATATIKHKRLGDISKTVFLSEWKVANNPNWTARPRHMLEIRALKQAARQIVHGIPFDEEERKIADEVNVTGTDEATQTAETPRPKVSRRGGAAAAAGSDPSVTAPVASKTKDEPPTLDADTGQPVGRTEPSAADLANAEAEAKAASEAAAKAEREATDKALKEREAKAAKAAAATAKKAESDAAAAKAEPVELTKVPEVAPGIGITQFLGRSYPVTLTGTIDALTPKQAGTTYFVTLTVTTPQGALEFVTFGGVKTLEGGKLDITNPALRVGGLIEFDVDAKLRKSAAKDASGKPLPDLTKPPALIASNIKDCEESPI